LFSIGKIIEKDAQGEIVEESELQTFLKSLIFSKTKSNSYGILCFGLV